MTVVVELLPFVTFLISIVYQRSSSVLVISRVNGGSQEMVIAVGKGKTLIWLGASRRPVYCISGNTIIGAHNVVKSGRTCISH